METAISQLNRTFSLGFVIPLGRPSRLRWGTPLRTRDVPGSPRPTPHTTAGALDFQAAGGGAGSMGGQPRKSTGVLPQHQTPCHRGSQPSNPSSMTSSSDGIFRRSSRHLRTAVLVCLLTMVHAWAGNQARVESIRPPGTFQRQVHNIPSATWQQLRLVPLTGSVLTESTLVIPVGSAEYVPPTPPPVRVPDGGSMLVMLGLGTAGILGLAKWMTKRHPLPPPTPMDGEWLPPGS